MGENALVGITSLLQNIGAFFGIFVFQLCEHFRRTAADIALFFVFGRVNDGDRVLVHRLVG